MAKTKVATPPRPWVTAREAGMISMRSVRALRGMARRGLVRTFTVEGLRPLYCREDLERIAPPKVASMATR